MEFFKITARVPTGQQREFMFMIDPLDPKALLKLTKFMLECCDETSDFYVDLMPDDMTAEEWRDKTSAKYESITGKTEVIFN